jgi:hypothetical protein
VMLAIDQRDYRRRFHRRIVASECRVR